MKVVYRNISHIFICGLFLKSPRFTYFYRKHVRRGFRFSTFKKFTFTYIHLHFIVQIYYERELREMLWKVIMIY
jgi:hypothetical protein